MARCVLILLLAGARLTCGRTMASSDECSTTAADPSQNGLSLSLLQYGTLASTVLVADPPAGEDKKEEKKDSNGDKAEDKAKEEKKEESSDGASTDKKKTDGEEASGNNDNNGGSKEANATNATNGTNSSNSSNKDKEANGEGDNLPVTWCGTKEDERTQSAWFAVTSPPGTPCVFGVEGDARDEASHCIYDNGLFGSNGWCYTSNDRSSWGSCNHLCPLYGSAQQLGKKIDAVAKVVKGLTKILNGTKDGAGTAEEKNETKTDAKATKKDAKKADDKESALLTGAAKAQDSEKAAPQNTAVLNAAAKTIDVKNAGPQNPVMLNAAKSSAQLSAAAKSSAQLNAAVKSSAQLNAAAKSVDMKQVDAVPH